MFNLFKKSNNNCPEGYTKRKTHTTKKGITVKASCVKKQKKSSSLNLLKMIPKVSFKNTFSCPPGMTLRKGYDRHFKQAILNKGFIKKGVNGKFKIIKPHKRNITHVKSKCVKNTSKSSGTKNKTLKKATIGPLKEGELTKHGYSVKLMQNRRRNALRMAIKEYGILNVYRKLDAVMKLTKTTQPEASTIYEKDRDWIKENYKY